MNYEWYETRTVATVVVYPLLEKEIEEIKKDSEYLHIRTKDTFYTIKIDHSYRVAGYSQKPNKKVEISLEKPACKKWVNLEENKEMKFTRQKQISDEKEEHSSDPVLNMFMDVYANASQEVKREMNRSFFESSGTEIRTHRNTEEYDAKHNKK